MSLSLISRPEDEQYGNSFISKWNAVHLPMLYKFSSDLFPTNNVDAAVPLTDQSNNNGQVTFESYGHPYVKLEWVTLSGTGITAYDGKIVQITDTNFGDFTVRCPYTAGALGGSAEALKYYKNYHIKVQLWTGLNPAHTDKAQDPSALRCTLEVDVNDDNVALVDVHKFCADHLRVNNDPNIPSWPNQISYWNEAIIKYEEAYDQSDGTDVTLFESGYTTDSDYIQFVQAMLAFRSLYGGNMREYALNAVDTDTKFLSKSLVLFDGFYFDITILIETSTTYNIIIWEKDVEGNIVNSVSQEHVIADKGLYRFRIDNLITSAANCIEVFMSKGVSNGISDFTWTENTDIPNADFIGWDCYINNQGHFFFCGRDDITGDALLYRSQDEGATWSLVLTGGSYTFTGIGNEGNDVAVCTSGASDVYYSSDDGDNFALMSNLPGTNGYDIFIISGTTYICFATNINGIFKTTDFGATAWTNISIGSGSFALKRMFWRTDQLGWVVGQTGRIYKTTNGGTGWTNQTTGTAFHEGIYMIDDSIGVICGQGGVILRTTDGGTTWGTITSGTAENLWDVEFLTAEVGYIVGSNGTILRTLDAGVTWSPDTSALGSDFSALAKNTGAAEALMLTSSSTVDSQKLVAVLEQLNATEMKDICVDRKCSNQNIYLTWLNNLGAYDYWNFTAEKEHSLVVNKDKTIARNVFNEWPLRFSKSTKAETWNNHHNINAQRSLLVRSQHLTAAQADFVSGILKSPHVQWVVDGIQDKVTVMIEPGAVPVRRESERLHTIQFLMLYTDPEPIQQI